MRRKFGVWDFGGNEATYLRMRLSKVGLSDFAGAQLYSNGYVGQFTIIRFLRNAKHVNYRLSGREKSILRSELGGSYGMRDFRRRVRFTTPRRRRELSEILQSYTPALAISER